MIKITKYLDRSKAVLGKENKSKESFVILYIRLNNKSLKLSTGYKINTDYCIMEKSSNGKKTSDCKIDKIYADDIKDKQIREEVQDVSDAIESMIQDIRKYEKKHNTDRELTIEQLKEYINSYKRLGKDTAEGNNVIALLDDFIDLRNKGDMSDNRFKPFAKNSINNYRSLRFNLVAISEFKKLDLKYISSNDFYRFFKDDWLLKQRKVKPSTIRFYIRVLKSFLNWCVSKNYLSSFNPSNWNTSNPKQDEELLFALTTEEVKKIMQVDLTDKPHLINPRNLFVIQIFTGLRFSDIQKLKVKDFDFVNKELIVLTQKTGALVKIKITKPLRVFLSKVDITTINFNTKITIMNRHLKKIGKEAGLIDTIKHIEFFDGQEHLMEIPKYELLGTHAARRTFVTQCLIRGLVPAAIQKLTGHSKLESFNKYIKFADAYLNKSLDDAFETNEFD